LHIIIVNINCNLIIIWFIFVVVMVIVDNSDDQVIVGSNNQISSAKISSCSNDDRLQVITYIYICEMNYKLAAFVASPNLVASPIFPAIFNFPCINAL